MKAIRDFFSGAACVGSGFLAFYGDWRSWKYVLLPWALMLVTYGLFFWGVYALTDRLTCWLDSELAALPAYLAWLSVLCQWGIWLLAGAGALLLLAFTASMFYAMLGGIFFDALAGYRLRKAYGAPIAPFSWRRLRHFVWASVLFGLETIVAGGTAFLLSWLVPFIGPVILWAVFGYYLAISLMIGAANCRGMSLGELRLRVRSNRAAVLGFGVMAYFLLLIPFSMLFLLPALTMGGADLFARHLNGCLHS